MLWHHILGTAFKKAPGHLYYEKYHSENFLILVEFSCFGLYCLPNFDLYFVIQFLFVDTDSQSTGIPLKPVIGVG